MMIKKRPRSDSNAQPTDNCPLVGFEVSGGAVHGLLQRPLCLHSAQNQPNFIHPVHCVHGVS